MTGLSLSRRAVFGGMASLAAAPAFARGGGDARPEATVAQGKLRGTLEKGVKVFRGIPFAAPPIGPLRFRPPAPPAPWSGTRDASTFASAPMQPPPPANIPYRMFLGAEISEDCLYLNIWEPEGPGPHPVFVWIHGGGNITGAASQGADGTAFAKAGVLTVTIAYRVGAFGFLELGKALGPSYHGSGVNGLRDQIAALHWIQENIRAFGGDPTRVTIGGGSAGAKNVVALMASPMARGLFSSAIVESGGETSHDLCSAEAVTDQFSNRLNDRGSTIRSIGTMPAADLNALQLEVIKAYDRPFPFRSIMGTDVVPIAPSSAFRKNRTEHRLLIGTNRDEAIMFIDRKSAAAPVTQHDLANMDVAAVRPVEAAYDTLFSDLDPLHRRVRLVAAEEYVIPTIRLAKAVMRRGDVWMYRFEQPAPSGPFAGWAVHGSDGMYAWKIFDDPLIAATFGKVGPDGRELGDDMNGRWSAFIHGQSPDTPNGVKWPKYDGESVMDFAGKSGSVGKLDVREVALWDGVELNKVGPGGCGQPRVS